MILTISEAARRAGVARSTLYEMKLRGDISFTKSLAGKQGIELSEIARVFPQVLSGIPTNPTMDDVNHCALRSAQLWTVIGNRYDQAKANRG
jgi:excisionase family DNA binding protein